jgi:hypothetical protein
MVIAINGRRRKLSARRVRSRMSFWHPAWLMADCDVLGSEPRWFTSRRSFALNALQRRQKGRSERRALKEALRADVF